MSKAENQTGIVRHNRDNTTEELGSADLITTLQNLGLQTDSLHLDSVPFTKFDIDEYGNVEVRVKRPDGYTSRCILLKHNNCTYVQVDTRITDDTGQRLGTEVMGTFPLPIIKIASNLLDQDKNHFEDLLFIAGDKGILSLKENGSISFSP